MTNARLILESLTLNYYNNSGPRTNNWAAGFYIKFSKLLNRNCINFYQILKSIFAIQFKIEVYSYRLDAGFA